MVQKKNENTFPKHISNSKTINGEDPYLPCVLPKHTQMKILHPFGQQLITLFIQNTVVNEKVSRRGYSVAKIDVSKSFS